MADARRQAGPCRDGPLRRVVVIQHAAEQERQCEDAEGDVGASS